MRKEHYDPDLHLDVQSMSMIMESHRYFQSLHHPFPDDDLGYLVCPIKFPPDSKTV